VALVVVVATGVVFNSSEWMQTGDLNITARQSTGVSMVRLNGPSTNWTQSGNILLDLLDQSSGVGTTCELLKYAQSGH
jgi:hypothetical protein